MREILFRGKRTDTREWVEGYYEFGYDSETETPTHYMWVLNHTEKCGEIFTVIPETVGQFTGLTDCNGKRIFEGDICLCDRNINRHIDKKGFIVEFEPLRGWIGESKDGWSEIEGSAWEWAEVIGNIHDNPELKGGE